MDFFSMWTDKLRASDDLEQTKLLHFVALFLRFVVHVALHRQTNAVGLPSSWFILCPIDFYVLRIV